MISFFAKKHPQQAPTNLPIRCFQRIHLDSSSTDDAQDERGSFIGGALAAILALDNETFDFA
jgi:hypothetical protein